MFKRCRDWNQKSIFEVKIHWNKRGQEHRERCCCSCCFICYASVAMDYCNRLWLIAKVKLLLDGSSSALHYGLVKKRTNEGRDGDAKLLFLTFWLEQEQTSRRTSQVAITPFQSSWHPHSHTSTAWYTHNQQRRKLHKARRVRVDVVLMDNV